MESLFKTYLGIPLFYVYWIPVFICLLECLVTTINDYLKDKKNRSKADLNGGMYYFPTLTIGIIVSRLIICFIPFINILYLIFKIIPVIHTLFSRWLNIPLVPRRKIY